MGLFGAIGGLLDTAAGGVASVATKVGKLFVPGPTTVIGTGPPAPGKSAVPLEPTPPHHVIHHIGERTAEKDDSASSPDGELPEYDPTGRPVAFPDGPGRTGLTPPVIPTFPEDREHRGGVPVQDDAGADPFQQDPSGVALTGTTGTSHDDSTTGHHDDGGEDQGYERSGYESSGHESSGTDGSADDDARPGHR